MEYKVQLKNVSKVYNLNKNKKDQILSLITLGKKNNVKPFYALRNITFDVKAGDSVGILGLNGSGKSTLANILAEVVRPTEGSVKILGESRMIAISAGLNNELSGLENIRMKCLMHGLSSKEVNEIEQDIIDFSELDRFIYQPIKNYSSGMRSRLGFAIAIHTNPDILIVDEALSVGDETFSNKCMEKMKQFQKEGKTIFFVSHAASQVRNMCNKAIWLHYGELVDQGNVNHIVSKYRKYIKEFKELSKEEQLKYKEEMSIKQRKYRESATNVKYHRPLLRYITPVAVFILFIISVILQLGIM